MGGEHQNNNEYLEAGNISGGGEEAKQSKWDFILENQNQFVENSGALKCKCQGERRFTWIQKEIFGVEKEKEARNLLKNLRQIVRL